MGDVIGKEEIDERKNWWKWDERESDVNESKLWNKLGDKKNYERLLVLTIVVRPSNGHIFKVIYD